MQIALEGPSGELVGDFEEPGEVRGAAVVCHPHPLHGGTRKNTIVVRTARALRSVGMSTLRFDFRGAGDSAGEHDGHGGETGDVAAALEWLERRVPGVPLWAAGYSFGARTVAQLAIRERRIEHVVLVALPVAIYDCSHLAELEQPGLLVFGGADEFGTAAGLRAGVPGLSRRLVIVEISAADHFFRGKTPLVEDAVRDHARAAWKEKQ